MATGLIKDPFVGLKAAAESAANANKTLWLRGGTYTLTADITPRAGMTIRACPRERVIIDLDTYDIIFDPTDSTNAILQGVEVTSSAATRANAGEITVHGSGVKLINCRLHDFKQVGVWEDAVGAEVNGCLAYNMGVPSSTQYHAFYTQNASGTKLFKHTLVLPTHSEYGIHAYAEAGTLDGFNFNGVLHVGKLWQIGGSAPFDNVEVQNCITYKSDLRIGYLLAVENGAINLHHNHFNGYLQCLSIGDWTMANNTMRAMPARSDLGILSISWNTGQSHSESINSNIYDIPAASGTPFTVSGTGRTFPQWQGFGYDAAGSLSYSDNGTDSVTIQASDYDTDHAHIIIENWSGATSKNVDLTSLVGVLVDGGAYVARYYQDPEVDYTNFVFNAASPQLTLDLQAASHSVAAPVGGGSTPAITLPDLGAWVIERQLRP